MTKPEDNIWKLYAEMFGLKPTPEEMDAFIDHYNSPHGVVTYSTDDKNRGVDSYFMSVHDNHNGRKHFHIDLGYGDSNQIHNNVTHLMLDNSWAKSFIDFIKEQRLKQI